MAVAGGETGGAPLVGGVGLERNGRGPSFGSQASAGVAQDRGAAQASAEKVRYWTKVLAPPVEWMASTATKQLTFRQLAPPSAVVRTAGRAREVVATRLAATVITEL